MSFLAIPNFRIADFSILVLSSWHHGRINDVDASSVPKDPQFTRHGADPRWRSLHPVSSHYSSIERPLLSLFYLFRFSSTPFLRNLTLSCASLGNRSFPSKSFLGDFLAVGNANENLSHLVPDDSSIFCPILPPLLSPPPFWRTAENLQPQRADRPRANHFSSFCSYWRPLLVNPRGISVYCLTSSPA